VGRPSTPRLLALHALRLKGVAEPAEVAEYVDGDAEVLAVELEGLEQQGYVTRRRGRFPGYALTDDGRALGERLLADELDAGDLRRRIEAAYEEFLRFNGQLLTVCTQWQLRTVGGETVANDHADPDHDAAVIDALVALDQHVQPVLASLQEALDRFGPHQRRLRYALDRVVAGEHDWLTKPMFPSYHSCWFELHEDLLATLGRERRREGSP
jgi:DNA-binding MarR family transcriptional regulator